MLLCLFSSLAVSLLDSAATDVSVSELASTIPLKMEEVLPESLHLLVISLEISLVRLGSSSKICLNNRSFNWRSAADFVVLS